MSGMEAYGLRAAKKIVRESRSFVKGENDAFAKGYRAALANVDRELTARLNQVVMEHEHGREPFA